MNRINEDSITWVPLKISGNHFRKNPSDLSITFPLPSPISHLPEFATLTQLKTPSFSSNLKFAA
jgi:hypothetical protein